MTNYAALAWIAALGDPDFHCEAVIHGAPGRLRVPERWSVDRVFPDEHLFYFPVEGRLQARVADAEFLVEAGALLWIPAGQPFHCFLPPAERLVLTRFRLQANPPIPWPVAEPHYVALYPHAESCRAWVEGIIREATQPEEPFHALRVRSLLTCLFTELTRLDAPADAHVGLSPAQRESLRALIADRAHRIPERGWPTPSELARHLRLSPDYFTRLFTKAYGIPPRRWLLEQRLQLAAIRLEESRLNISEIAAEMGYENVFLFSRQFKAVLGQAPTEYRRSR